MAIYIRGELTVGWVVAFAAMIIITLVTIVGNTVMLMAVRRAKRAPAHFALRSLLAADLMVGLCVLPIAAARELFVFHLPWLLCAFWSTFDVLCCTASILSICALGWERWSGITAPFGLSRRTRKVKILVALLWPVSIAIALPTGFVPSPLHYENGETLKACTVNINVVVGRASAASSAIFITNILEFSSAFDVIPYVADSSTSNAALNSLFQNSTTDNKPFSPRLSKCRGSIIQENNNESKKVTIKTPNLDRPEEELKNCKLYLTPKCSHLALPSPLPSPLRGISPRKSATTLSSIIPRQRRATQAIVMIMSLFLLCWSPFFIMLPMDSICNCVRDTTWQWCTWLGYANSALNPLVYAAASPSVRRALPASIPLTTSSKSTDMISVR